MTSTNFYRLLALVLVLVSTAAHAQFPTNNAVWKMRCDLLVSQDSLIGAGKAPKELVAATKGVPGAQTAALGLERSDAAQHSVACAMFYLAAIADRAGNGGKVDNGASDNDLTLARAEAKVAAGQSLSFGEKASSMKAKMSISRTLNGGQSTAVVNAASTMPITLAPAPNLKADARIAPKKR